MNLSGTKAVTDGDALNEAQLSDPTGLCLIDGERKLLFTDSDALRELTLPTCSDVRLL